MHTRLVLRIMLLVLFAPQAGLGGSTEVDPPSDYDHHVNRSFVEGKPFPLVVKGKTAFAILVADESDTVLMTAANDLALYFKLRYGVAPNVVETLDRVRENLIVLSSAASASRLPHSVQPRISDREGLAKEGFIIQQVGLPGERAALVCLGGSSLGARYATIEILRRMSMARSDVTVSIQQLRDEPYFTRRILYLNDSAHQMNRYSPNLIYDVGTYRWSVVEWQRFIDQLAFFRYNILQIWLVPNLFSPKALEGGGVFNYFRDTIRAAAQYAAPRGITLNLLAPINASVGAGTRLDTLDCCKDLPVYTYLSPNKSEEKALLLRLWDHWTKALPEVGIWTVFPGDPGGCMEPGCSPETYVDLGLEVSGIIQKNNPQALFDFNAWHFSGWGADVEGGTNHLGLVDRGYQYLLLRLKEYPPTATVTLNVNDNTSQPPIRGGGDAGGSTTEYMGQINASGHRVHTWTYFVTEGEGWLDHQYRVPQIIKQRDVEARFPISGGICYTMTPGLNILNQFACAEAFWDPKVNDKEVMDRYTEGIFGVKGNDLSEIFPTFGIAPHVGYTFSNPEPWSPDFSKILVQMRHNQKILASLNLPPQPRFSILLSPELYIGELMDISRLYERVSELGLKVAAAREIVRQVPSFKDRPPDSIRIKDAEASLSQLHGQEKVKLQRLIHEIEAMDVSKMKATVRSGRYQIFLDHPSEFSVMVPNLINWFFNSFGADFSRAD
jgi:hypothetical protein